MNPNTLEVVEGIGHFRLCGPWIFSQAVQAAIAAVNEARGRGLKQLLIVTTAATGFDPPCMADRHAMVRKLSHASMGRVTIAMVVPHAFIDPERFAVVAAGNFGLHLNVFDDEAEALGWLRAAR